MSSPASAATTQAILDDFFNSIHKPRHNLTLGTGGTTKLITSHPELKHSVLPTSPTTLWSYVPQTPTTSKIVGEFEDTAIPIGTDAYILYIEAPMTMGNKLITHLVVVVGPSIMIRIVTQRKRHLFEMESAFPRADWEQHQFRPPTEGTMPGLRPPEVPIYVIKEADIVSFMKDGQVSQTSKVLTMIYFLFGSTARWFETEFTIYDYPHPPNPKYKPATVSEAETIVFTSLAILGNTYSQASTLGEQIHRRLGAAAATDGFSIPGVNVVIDAITTSQWTPSSGGGLVAEALGRVIAINSQFVYEPDIPETKLCTADDYKDGFPCNPWTLALFKQARMIYRGFQTTTLNFAIDVLSVSKKLIEAQDQSWILEWKLVETHATKLAGRPYIGLRSSIPDDRQIARFPRIAYMGALYHASCMVDEKEKENFKRYNILGVKQHIENRGDIPVIESMAKSFPSVTLSSIAKLLRNSDLEESIQLLVGLTPDQQNAMYYHLKATYPNAAWFVAEKSVRESGESVRIVKNILALIDATFAETRARMNRAAAMETDNNKRAALYDQLATLEEKVRASKEALAPFAERVIPVQSSEFVKLRADLITKYGPLYKLASEGK